MRIKLFNLLFLSVVLSLSSCKVYQQNYMFKADSSDLTRLGADLAQAEANYTIAPNDQLEIDVYTHDGERIIDPDFELRSGQNANRNYQDDKMNEFAVLPDSTIKLPLVGHVNLTGLTLGEAETYLEEKYADFYQDPMVKLKYTNKRIIILGAPGGRLIPLENESLSVIEAIALAGGIDENGKSSNIRLIRGPLHNPEVYLIDLSTIQGMKNSMLKVESGDIIYIEPTKKIFTESLRDFTLVLATITNLVTIYFLIDRAQQ